MNLTNRHLYQFHNEITQFSGSILKYFLKGKINEFYKHNEIRIETLYEKIGALQEEHFVIEDNNIKHEGEGKDQKPVMKEGKTREEFDKRYEEIMNTEINVVL